MLTADSLAGKTILITGGTSGLGLAMAEKCLLLGARVAICSRSPEKVAAAQQLLAAGDRVFAQAIDVRDAAAVESFVSASIAHFGEVNCLVNNAAGNFYSASEDLSSNAFRSVIDTVLVGSFHCSRELGRYWIEKGIQGVMLNIVTTYTATGSSFVLPSACAKAGVAAMTTTLAYEWAEYGIRVNGLAPGPIPTEGAWQRLMPGADFEAAYKARLPMKRFGKKEELATVAAFLLSDAAAYINGVLLPMDGGEHLQGGEFNFLTSLMPRAKLKELFGRMKPKKDTASA